MVLVIGARQTVGAEQRLAVHLQADHRELAILEAQGGIPRGGEGEERVGPVMDGQHALLAQMAIFPGGWRDGDALLIAALHAVGRTGGASAQAWVEISGQVEHARGCSIRAWIRCQAGWQA